MSLNYVTVTWNELDLGGGNLSGRISFALSNRLVDSSDSIEISNVPAKDYPFISSTGSSGPLVANDNINALPQNTYYTVTITISGQQPFSFTAPINYANGATQKLSSLEATPSLPVLLQYLAIPAGTPTAGYVPIATGSGEATVWGPNGTGGSGYPATPTVSGTPTTGQVLTATSGTTANWQTPSGGGAVSSVFTRTGAVVAASGDYTVGQVTGAAPLASPALTGTPTAPTQAALTNNTDIATTAYADAAVGVEKTRALAAEALLAPLASPALTGNPTAPTQAALNNSTRVATTAYTDAAVGVETTRATTAEALLAPLASPALTGTPTAPTKAALTNNTDIATTAYADAAVGVEKTRALAAEALLAPLASPALTGTPTAPTKSALTNNTDIATTAYTDAAVGVETTRATAAEALALPKAGGTMTGWLAPAVSALTFVGSGTTLVNAALGNAFNLTLTASTTTLGAPSNPVDGQVIRIRVTQGAGGSFTLAYGTAYDFGAAGAPTLSTAAGKVDILGFEYVASISKWCYLGSGLGF